MTVRVAVVGLGWAARSIWLPRLHAHTAFDVTAVVDPAPAARDWAAGHYPGVPVLTDVDELGPDRIDLAVVAVPNHLHSAVAGRLLSGGTPVFVEKPVCLSPAEAGQLAAAEQAGGAVLLAGSAARYRTDVRALYDVVAQRIGRIRHVTLAWVRSRGVPDAGGWFTRQHLSGGGALVDLGWHLLDTVLPLLGDAPFDQVAGVVSSDFLDAGGWGAAWRDEPGATEAETGDVEDTARGFMVTRDGVAVSLRASWASHEALDSTLIEVEGSAGTATLHCTFGFSPNRRHGSSLTCTSGGKTVEVPVADAAVGEEYAHQLDALPALLADPAGKGRAVAEARRIVEAIQHVYASARPYRTADQQVRVAPAVR
ncbi:Gfo/Idh/MocA family protein [Dactylosporangium sp. NPDC048998]|uniref:Gfo/Idh/MocA family protein n=1 Tax=Dactylosporangium sp. NPDC048998 TaxID=3363976 RepID=UPI0037137514